MLTLLSRITNIFIPFKSEEPSEKFKIAIVVDMWLTGFDVPSLATMYVYKPMHGYNLMQAIARVNRVFKDKDWWFGGNDYSGRPVGGVGHRLSRGRWNASHGFPRKLLPRPYQLQQPRAGLQYLPILCRYGDGRYPCEGS